MSLRACVAVLLAAMGLWVASGTEREKPVVATAQTAQIRALEADVVAHPHDEAALTKLAQAYLDARSPGMAVAVIERAPLDVRTKVVVDHAYARALVAQGRNVDALHAEARVLSTCSIAACDPVLVASAQRRADILRELIHLGVEDAQAHPEESRIAYRTATREARIAVR